MKTWKEKVLLPDLGVCTVKELTDEEATRLINRGENAAPISSVFVSLYQQGKYVGYCGVNFARKRRIADKAIIAKWLATKETRDPVDFGWYFTNGQEARVANMSEEQLKQALMQCIETLQCIKFATMTTSEMAKLGIKD